VFGHVLELSQDNPRAAYGLSRIRLIQNNLSGAEGWIQLALRKRPRRAAYHAHYAEVLTRMGRMAEAREEQARASANRDSEEP
jgi:predicted Zn-dependent protease